jgi:hypothetical protein
MRISQLILFSIKITLSTEMNQSSKGMKKGLHRLGEETKANYSPINEVFSIAVL